MVISFVDGGTVARIVYFLKKNMKFLEESTPKNSLTNEYLFLMSKPTQRHYIIGRAYCSSSNL